MRQITLTIPEVAFIAGTRGALGAGLGLLASGRMKQSRRRALGWTLLAVGALATIPAARRVLGGRSIFGDRARKLNGARGVVDTKRGIPGAQLPLVSERVPEFARDEVEVG
jgi:multisubunit Na+/H+ antiporter MnhB subunit